MLNIKKKESEASNERFQYLQEELVCLQMELGEIKKAPMDKGSKGNSLFAEVEDNRLILKDHVKKLNQKLIDLQNNYRMKNLELQNLQSVYGSLRMAIDQKDNDNLHEHIVQTYK